MNARHAVVTGGSRGIGAAIACALTKRGCVVTVLGRDEAALGGVLEKGWAAGLAIADVTDAAMVQQALADAALRHGPVDILVNNAGIASSASFEETSAGEFERLFAVNVLGCVHAIHAALPSMRERGFGRVVTIASTAAVKGYAYVSAYVTAKHAALGLMRALAIEHAQSGVTFNAICPGFTESDLLDASVNRIVQTTGRTVEQARADLARFNPQRRLIKPEEVADAAAFLCGVDAGSLNGVCLPVAGGEIM